MRKAAPASPLRMAFRRLAALALMVTALAAWLIEDPRRWARRRGPLPGSVDLRYAGSAKAQRWGGSMAIDEGRVARAPYAADPARARRLFGEAPSPTRTAF